MLELVAELYCSLEKKEARRKIAQTTDNVGMFIKWVSSSECKETVSPRVKVLITNFEDFLATRRTVKQAGPKTLQQIHNEIKQENRENLADRHKHERQKKDERMRAKPKPRFTKSRQNTAQKKANAVLASASTGNSTSLKNFTLLKRPEKPFGKPFYFDKNKFDTLDPEADEQPEDVVVKKPADEPIEKPIEEKSEQAIS